MTTTNPTAERTCAIEGTAAASALCDEVIADLGDDVRTHGPDCYRWHAGCLALRVRQALAAQGPQALDPEKVADVIHHAFPADSPYRCAHIINAPCVALATALCEAAKRGELT